MLFKDYRHVSKSGKVTDVHQQQRVTVSTFTISNVRSKSTYHILQHSHFMLSVEKYQGTLCHHGGFPCCFMAKPRGGGWGRCRAAQKQEVCVHACVYEYVCVCAPVREWGKLLKWSWVPLQWVSLGNLPPHESSWENLDEENDWGFICLTSTATVRESWKQLGHWRGSRRRLPLHWVAPSGQTGCVWKWHVVGKRGAVFNN